MPRKSKKKQSKLKMWLVIVPVVVLVVVGLSIVAYWHWSNFNNNWPVGELTPTGSKQGKPMTKQIIRPAAMAGSFYPADKDELELMIRNFIDNASTTSKENLRALIVPHAGYEFSGQVAAYSFKQIDPKQFDRVIILGPSHHYPVQGIFASGADFWETPLGQIKIWKDPEISNNAEIHAPEHSSEVEVPFLQVVFGSDSKMEILPLIVGALNDNQIDQFVVWLKQKLSDDRTLLVVSVDLSHYHDYETAKKLDEQSINTILALDRAGVDNLEIDAPFAIKAVLQLAKDLGWQPRLLQYANSGDVTGDKSRVVGYGAMGFYGESPKSPPIRRAGAVQSPKLDEYTKEEKQELLKVARTTLEMHYQNGETYEPKTDNSKFLAKRGVFVTLNKHGQLRGCIGYIEPIKPLIEAVRDNALAAALDDHRFSPVREEELKDIEIEISILTVPQPTTLNDIRPGIDGVVLRQGNRGATYLPQVWEQLPTRELFFSSLSQKAGLGADSWKDRETEFYSYQAIVFGE